MLPCAENLPEGTLWRLNGKYYVSESNVWKTINKEDCEFLDFKNDNDNQAYEPLKETYKLPEPLQRIMRGRPAKNNKPNQKKRAPTDYNEFIKTHMLNGDFADLNGQERLSKISQLYKASK